MTAVMLGYQLSKRKHLQTADTRCQTVKKHEMNYSTLSIHIKSAHQKIWYMHTKHAIMPGHTASEI